MNRHIGTPSPAMVVAGIALVVAMGGTGYAAIKLPANSVGPKQLKKRAVTGPKIAAGAISGASVRNGSLGVKDFDARQLPAGPPGPPGGQGPPGVGVSGYERVSATKVVERDATFFEGDVQCPAGKKILGAGGWRLTYMAPTIPPSEQDVAFARVEDEELPNDTTYVVSGAIDYPISLESKLTVTAVCASVGR